MRGRGCRLVAPFRAARDWARATAAGGDSMSRMPNSSLCRSESADECGDLDLDLALNSRQRHGRVDDFDALGILLSQRQVRGPHPLEERSLLALEMIRRSVVDAAGADLEWCIEQQSQVRLQPFLYFRPQRVEQGAAGSASAPLIRDGGIRESIADDP